MHPFKIRNFFLPLSLSVFLSGCFSQSQNFSEHQWGLIHQAEDSFNAQTREQGQFIQTGNFRRGSGSFVLEPGRLCLNYDAPNPGSLFVDSTHLIQEDQKTGARTSFKVSETPFVRFLKAPVHFSAQSTRIEAVEENPQGYAVTLSKTYRMKKCVVTLLFSKKEEGAQLSGLQASIAGYYLQALFQNISQQKMNQTPVCRPPS